MVTAAHQVFNEIKEYIRKKAEQYQGWYAGTTSEVCRGFFLENNVTGKNNFWI